MRELKAVIILAVLVLGSVIVYRPVADFARSFPYKFEARGYVVVDASREIQKRFDSAVPQGSYGNANGPVIFYSSFYDESTRTYFYRIRNNSNKEFYARSRIFLILLGEASVAISSKNDLYAGVQDLRPPVEREETLYLADDRYSLNLSRGIGMKLVMPEEKPQHHLVWRPRY
ncbi:MAG: hypothetical protein HY434_02085 [Candidatus Liptonbacteria bacterium]|nr:hypothetical protein [Candidatus Liptonbacteria bacterium]